MPARLRLVAALLALASLSSCFDMPDPEEETDEKAISEAERELKFRQAVDAKGKSSHGSKVQLREFGTEAPKKLAPPEEQQVAVAPKAEPQTKLPAGDGGVADVVAPKETEALVEAPPEEPLKPLVLAWKEAKPGDFVNVKCLADVTMFQNQVVRNVTVKMAVKSATEEKVVLVIDAQGTEDRPLKKPKKGQKPPKKLDIKGSYELEIARAPAGSRTPEPPLPLGDASEKELKIGKDTAKAACTREDQSKDGGPLRERCVSADPAIAYLTNGALRLTEEWKTKRSEGKKSCEVVAFGHGAPPPAAKRTSATEWTYADRGDGHFREQVASASAGLVEVKSDRLAVAKKTDKETVTFADKKYTVGVGDRRTVPLLDWALQRTIPDFPPQLSDE